MAQGDVSGYSAASHAGRGEGRPAPRVAGEVEAEGPSRTGTMTGGISAATQSRRTDTQADLWEFRRAIDAATRYTIVTPMIALACGLVFVAMAVSGVPVFWPKAAQLIGWGANDGARLVLREEYWRLAASVFIHGGLIHLVVNVWSLLVIGPLVERIYGHLAFAVIYLASGIGGAIASATMPPLRVSVGASGAICGILGGLLAFLAVHRRAIPRSVLKQLLRSVLIVVASVVALGLLLPRNIDQAAHLGGLAVGFVCGLLLIGPWPVVPDGRVRRVMSRLAITVLIAAALSGIAVAAAHRGEHAIPPSRRIQDLSEQIVPILKEFSEVRVELARSIDLFGNRRDEGRRSAGQAVIQGLRARSLANDERLRAVTTSDPELREICDALVRAQSGQIDRLSALARYLETGDDREVDSARRALAATIQATRDFEALQLRYMNQYGLAPSRPAAKPEQ